MLFMFSVGITGTLDSDVKVSLQFEDIALSTVLNMFAEQYDLNLIQSGQIDGNVSVKLDNVKLRDALEAILASNGYNYYLAGDIIVVKPLEMNAIGEMVARTIKLDYITPSAAINAISDLLSSKGKIKVVQGTSGNSSTKESVPTKIVIVDLPDVVDMITAFIKEIDCRQPQVAIKVRLIETNIDDDTKIGFKWPTNLSARLHGVQGSSSSTSGSTESSEAFAQMQLPDGGWTWGKMSIAEVSAALEFLDLQGNSKLISDPYITTLDNHEAEIKVTTIIPIQTINRFSEGGSVQDIVSFQDEEIGITLLVTPHITNDGQIILDVKPSVAEIIGYSGPADSQKPITSERSIHTKIIVKNNETAVLGGLMKENKIEEEQRVFFLGSLPIIGGLFRHKSTQTRTTDLTIMITPTIIRD
jgi:type II secretory pathway component GspD/PulD (secretin)